MSQEGALVVLTGTDLQKCDKSIILTLFNVINTAYHRNNVKFNIMKNDRIKDVSVFLSDIGFDKNSDNCVLIVYFEGPVANAHAFDVNTFEGHQFYTPKSSVEVIPAFTENDTILGTVGFKPHHDYADGEHFEVTSFTSLKPKLGTTLLPLCERYFAKMFKVKQYIAEVVVEHDLVPYYTEKHNYVETKRFFVPKDYDPVTTGLEPGIEAEPFFMATMIKDVN
ncbi:hypothetical protein ACO0QE_000566 [Hanseniaspora vineae]